MRPPSFSYRYASAIFTVTWIILSATGDAQSLPPRTAIILAINDVYRIEGLNYDYNKGEPDKHKGVGGLARLRTLRDKLDKKQRELNENLLKKLDDILQHNELNDEQRTLHEELRDTLNREIREREGGSILLLHAGDFLFPSLLSREYPGEQIPEVLRERVLGEQMIAVLNCLAGTRPCDNSKENATLDKNMIVVFGNHEFEETSCVSGASNLRQNIENSRFIWLQTNIKFADCFGLSRRTTERLQNDMLVAVGGIKIGIFGITTAITKPDYVRSFDTPVKTARDLSASLRNEKKADIVIALTHLDKAQDKEILRVLHNEGPDLIVGGHDHEKMALSEEWKTVVNAASGALVAKVERTEQRHVYKADADARTASIITITVSDDSGIAIHHQSVKLNNEIEPDRNVTDEVNRWLKKHESELCMRLPQEESKEQDVENCLRKELAEIQTTDLVGEEAKIRSSETSLGNWVTDLMRKACGAEVAFINSGSLRLNQDLEAGLMIRRRHVEELFAYPTPLRLVKITGGDLQKVVAHGVQEWPGSGRWLQVSGFAFRHKHDDLQTDPAKKDQVTDLTLLTPKGRRPVSESEAIRAVTSDFLLGGGDGYEMLKKAQREGDCAVEVSDNRKSNDLKAIVLQALRTNITPPKAEGRICQDWKSGPECLENSDTGKGNSILPSDLSFSWWISLPLLLTPFLLLVLGSFCVWHILVGNKAP
jgi:2',3'-cyclic-nucleotide 2'-phosphodiesterase (5'-nucleotidase family)